ncbi:MAG: amidotransferase [Bacteroidia bacterium]|nr:amidotransferase [Bacteroidia bacterium]
MKTALLVCDHINENFHHISPDYTTMFRQLLPELNLVPYRVIDGEFPENVQTFDAYIVTGSRFSVYDEVEWVLRLKSFVREIYVSGKKYVGVCFGHQMLGEALGGKVEKSPSGWCVGVHSFSLLETEPWMFPFQPEVNLLMMCQDQVMRLPENSIHLATTADCPVAMFRVGENMLGIQAHPEFPLAYDRALMENRITRIGQEKVEAGIQSLSKTPDKEVVANWIIRFLRTQM